MELQEMEKKLEDIRDKLLDIEKTLEKRIFLTCDAQNVLDICKFLYEVLGCRFVIATGIDSDEYFEVLHHFSCDLNGTILTVKALVRDKENPVIESIANLIPAADWIEREIHDVLGIEFRNHPDMRRLILHDDWPEGVYPMRKERLK